MLERLVRAAALSGILVGTALAGDPPRPIPPERMAGATAFEWTRSGAHCRAVDAALVKRWQKGYVCMPPDDPAASASGRPIAASCKAQKGRSEFLVFKARADCEEEQKTQAANGD